MQSISNMLVSNFTQPFVLLGVSHKTLPVRERERLTRLAPDAAGLVQIIAERTGLTELAVISTCNRFEILAVGDEAEERMLQMITTELPDLDIVNGLYIHRNENAVRHFLRVVASLDSMVLGEPQIVGQVKEAYRASVDQQRTGRFLHHLFQFGFSLAKKVRSTTNIGAHGVSVSYIAVKLAQQIFGSLAERSVLVLGSGRMAELAVLHLKSYGCSNVIVANRTIEKATELADRIGGSVISLHEIERYLSRVDVVIGSINIDRPILDRSSVELRRERPLFLIDLGVPRNFSPTLQEIDQLYLYNVDDLSQLASENREVREDAAKDAEIVIEYGLLQFQRWLHKVAAEPVTRSLRQLIEEICGAEVTRLLRQESGTLSAEQHALLAGELGRRIAAKVSHEVTRIVSALPHASSESPHAASVTKSDEEKWETLLPLVFDEVLSAL